MAELVRALGLECVELGGVEELDQVAGEEHKAETADDVARLVGGNLVAARRRRR